MRKSLSVSTSLSESPRSSIKAGSLRTDSVTENVITASREAKYRPVLKRVSGSDTTSAAHAAALFALLTFLATPQGVGCVIFGVQFCSAFISIEYVKQYPYSSFFVGGSLTGILSVVTFVPFARFWDSLYNDNPELRCQRSKYFHFMIFYWHSLLFCVSLLSCSYSPNQCCVTLCWPTIYFREYTVYGKPFFERLEVQLAILNLVLAAFLTSAIAVIAVVAPSWVKIYSNVEDFGWPYFFFSSILYVFFSSILYVP